MGTSTIPVDVGALGFVVKIPDIVTNDHKNRIYCLVVVAVPADSKISLKIFKKLSSILKWKCKNVAHEEVNNSSCSCRLLEIVPIERIPDSQCLKEIHCTYK